MKITPDVLRDATGCTSALAEVYAGHLAQSCEHFAINTPARLAAFLAQVGHESGGLRYVRELASGDAYEGRNDLGNTEAGDGPRYRGRGLIQVTGRTNYRAAARRLQSLDAPDFEDFPAALEEPKWAAWSAADWWHANGCNELADAGEFIKLGRLINRGSAEAIRPANGEPDRLARWERAKTALATATSPATADAPTANPDEPAGHWRAPAGEADITQPLEQPMAPFIAAALPALVDIIPKLGAMFGSGSAVAERNVKAAEVVVAAAKQAIGARNEQELVERVKSDPAAAATVRQAVESRWLDIIEAGGGGMDGARKADAAMQSTGDIRKSASFWIALLLLPLVYLLVLSIIGLIGTAQWSDDVRAGLSGSLISAIVGGLVGYYYGQTTSRNRTAKD